MNRTDKTARKYFGDVAAGYESRRIPQDKWKREQAIISEWLKRYPAGTCILDCPVGTGRFLGLYAELELDVAGVDISPDMLRLAQQKAANGQVLQQGSIFDLGELRPDVALSIRIMNLVGQADMQRALRELQRVTRREIIFNLREGLPGRHRHPHPLSAVQAALTGAWRIVENVPIHEDDFRMIRLSNGPVRAVD